MPCVLLQPRRKNTHRDTKHVMTDVQGRATGVNDLLNISAERQFDDVRSDVEDTFVDGDGQ